MNQRGLIASLIATIGLFLLGMLFYVFPLFMIWLTIFMLLAAFAYGVYQLVDLSEKHNLGYLEFNRKKHKDEPKL